MVLLSLQGCDHDARTQMDPIALLALSHDLTNGASEHTSQRGRAAVNNGDVKAKITADRGSFTADKAAAHDQDMPKPRAGTPRSHRASSRWNCASVVCSTASRPPKTCLERGGRS